MHVHFHSFPLLFKNLIFFRERVTIRKEQEEDLEKSLLEDRKVDGKSIGGQLSLLKLTLEDKNTVCIPRLSYLVGTIHTSNIKSQMH